MSRKIGDEIGFKFAGGIERGTIRDIEKRGNKILSYSIWDGKYNYTITKDCIL
jgi:hypothetical protein|tara:strand:- start:418 stop:576 length:159 start_codon:yes stop_codon:yes gene_type:complete